MAKLSIGLALVVAVGAFFVFGRESKARAVSECVEKAGAMVTKSRHFQELFPYFMAVGESTRVRSFPELERATVYGVQYGEGEALLFVGKDSEAAQSFEQTLIDFGASGGVDIPSRRADNVLLLWTVPTAASAPVDECIE